MRTPRGGDAMKKIPPEFERHESDQDADYTQEDLDRFDSDEYLSSFGPSHLIEVRLSEALSDLAQSDAYNAPARLRIPYTELAANPDIARNHMEELQQLSRMLRERIPAGPIDPTSWLPGLYINHHRSIEEVLDFIKTAGHGKSFREKQKEKSDKSSLLRAEARKPEWEKWQAAANKVWKKQPKWEAPAVAAMICHLFDVKADTIRKRIKKPTL
jgi:hypothetical protein